MRNDSKVNKYERVLENTLQLVNTVSKAFSNLFKINQTFETFGASSHTRFTMWLNSDANNVT